MPHREAVSTRLERMSRRRKTESIGPAEPGDCPGRRGWSSREHCSGRARRRWASLQGERTGKHMRFQTRLVRHDSRLENADEETKSSVNVMVRMTRKCACQQPSTGLRERERGAGGAASVVKEEGKGDRGGSGLRGVRLARSMRRRSGQSREQQPEVCV